MATKTWGQMTPQEQQAAWTGSANGYVAGMDTATAAQWQAKKAAEQRAAKATADAAAAAAKQKADADKAAAAAKAAEDAKKAAATAQQTQQQTQQQAQSAGVAGMGTPAVATGGVSSLSGMAPLVTQAPAQPVYQPAAKAATPITYDPAKYNLNIKDPSGVPMPWANTAEGIALAQKYNAAKNAAKGAPGFPDMATWYKGGQQAFIDPNAGKTFTTTGTSQNGTQATGNSRGTAANTGGLIPAGSNNVVTNAIENPNLNPSTALPEGSEAQGATMGYTPGQVQLPDLPVYQNIDPNALGGYQGMPQEWINQIIALSQPNPQMQEAIDFQRGAMVDKVSEGYTTEYLKMLAAQGLDPLKEGLDYALSAADSDYNRRGLRDSGFLTSEKFGAQPGSLSRNFMEAVRDLNTNVALRGAEALREDRFRNAGLQSNASQNLANMLNNQSGMAVNGIMSANQLRQGDEANRQWWQNLTNSATSQNNQNQQAQWGNALDIGKWLTGREDSLSQANADRDLNIQKYNNDQKRQAVLDALSFIYGMQPAANSSIDTQNINNKNAADRAKEQEDALAGIFGVLGGLGGSRNNAQPPVLPSGTDYALKLNNPTYGIGGKI